jgi:predicted dinucleotide-binding enzyme
MKIGIFGSSTVAQTIGSKLVNLGHEVMISSRDLDKAKDDAPSPAEWATTNSAQAGSFAEAAAFGEILFNCTAGMHSVEAISTANLNDLDGKILVDVANPLDFSGGFPPSLSVCNTSSLGEQLQSAFPELKVVKTLNTVNANLMVDATRVSSPTTIFIAGNDAGAKSQVKDTFLTAFGWKDIIDLGDITNARATEMYLPLWVRLYGTLNTADFNISVAR